MTGTGGVATKLFTKADDYAARARTGGDEHDYSFVMRVIRNADGPCK